jgi:outer membrane biosynthesis protein TonB
MRLDRADASAAAIAVVGHGAILAGLIYGLGKVAVVPPPPPAIEVSFVEEVGDVSAGLTTEPSAPPAGGEPPPPPAEMTEPEPVEAPMPSPSPVAVRQPQPRPQARPQQRQPAAQPQQQQRRTSSQPNPRRPLTEEALGGFGNDPASRNTRPSGAVVSDQARASMDAAILAALQRCRRQPLPAPEARAIRVRVEVTLNPNGSLASTNILSVSGATGPLAIYAERMRDLATNVVEQCAPIRGLPAEYYNVRRGWRTFRYTFPE